MYIYFKKNLCTHSKITVNTYAHIYVGRLAWNRIKFFFFYHPPSKPIILNWQQNTTYTSSILHGSVTLFLFSFHKSTFARSCFGWTRRSGTSATAAVIWDRIIDFLFPFRLSKTFSSLPCLLFLTEEDSFFIFFPLSFPSKCLWMEKRERESLLCGGKLTWKKTRTAARGI